MLKVKVCNANINQKKAKLAKLISVKADFRTRKNYQG